MFNDTEKYFMIFLCVCLFIGTQFNLEFEKKIIIDNVNGRDEQTKFIFVILQIHIV